MRILQLVQQPARRGAEMFARQLTLELSSRGHACTTAYLYDWAGEDRLDLGPDDFVLGHDQNAVVDRLALDPRLLFRVSSLCREIRPDLVQLNGGRTVKYGAALRSLLPRRSRIVYRNIGDPRQWVRGRAKRLVYARIFGRVDGIVSLSEDAQRTFREVFAVRVPIETIPSAFDPKHVEPRVVRNVVRARHETPEHAPIALFVGSFSPEKRLDRLLRVFAGTRRDCPSAYLWLVGSGARVEETRANADRLGLSGCVRFIGPQPDVGSYYAAADVSVLTSDTEGMPAVLLEAGFAGLPSVATHVGFIPACVLHERTGFLAAPAAEDELSAWLARTLSDPGLRARLGAAARNHVMQSFTISAVADRYLDFYERVLHGAAGVA